MMKRRTAAKFDGCAALFCVFSKVQKKNLHITGKSCIITNVVTLIAVKREVAAGHAGVPWSECQVRKLTASHCTN